MTDVIKIVNDIKSKNFKPIYFLCGEETYYIDRISDLIEETALSEDEKAFNQIVLYGRDTSVEEIVSTAKRFPMMSDYQVVIVKEAQNLVKTFENFANYMANVQPTTILVFAYRAKPDGRKKIFKTIKDIGVYFESKKLYDNQVPDWIVKVLKGQNYGIEPKAAAMLAEFLGTDLAKINNELDKLKIVLPAGHVFTPKNIEENIMINFNEIELYRIIDNNISNAIKYSKDSSCIEISLQKEEQKIKFSVKDEGIGIKDTSKIFERYYRGDKITGGFGIGLSIVKNICLKNSIKIDVESKENFGTTFIYTFNL